MNQHPDKLFRDKLEHFHQPVPSSAWLKVEAQLEKKSQKPFWLKIAAALIFLLAASALLLLVDNNTSKQHTATNQSQNKNPQPSNKNDSPVTAIDSMKVSAPEEIKIAKERTNKQTSVPQKKSVTKNKKENIEIDQQKFVQQQIAEIHPQEMLDPTEANKVVKNSDVPLIKSSDHSIVHKEEETETTITLIYDAEEVNDKYLNKKTLTEATSENKKPSTLKKLLDKAYDLKHNQDAFGELRQKKNEILALNFKSDKQRSQNR